MFDSPQFIEDLSMFQKLLAEGVFDFSPSGKTKSEGSGNLKRLVLCNLTRSTWVEHYNLLKVQPHNFLAVTIVDCFIKWLSADIDDYNPICFWL